MLLNNTHPFDQHPLLLWQHLQNLPARTPEIPRDHFDVVAFLNLKFDPVHNVKVAQASSLWGQQASRLRAFDRQDACRPPSQDGCPMKNSPFSITPPPPPRPP